MTSHRPDILIVDDTLDNIRFLSKMLLDRGYNVRKAINGKMALTAIEAVLPDLILLDINMPDMNGYEVCEQLKADPKTRTVPVIFLSALNDVADKVKAFQMGGVDYISKPFQFEEVLARIQNQLTIQSLQSQLKNKNCKLKKTLNNLQETQSQLVQKEKAIVIGQLVAGVAHEINNPVSFIYSNLTPAREYIQDLLNLIDLYQEEYPEPSAKIRERMYEIDLEFLHSDLKKILESMQSGADRIRTIVLGLRLFSRLDEADIKAIDLHENINSTVMLLQHRLDPKDDRPSIEVVKDYHDLPMVTCHARRLNQVFFNLLNNAIDAIEQKMADYPEFSNPQLLIRTRVLDDYRVTISIADNGIGMPKEVRSRLFDPFFTTKPVGKGRGLGLSTSYQVVVQQHHGKLTCEPLPGGGSEFVLEIPVYSSSPDT
ncbi:hybrid sensor histidine kinase/response regulator [Oscillatoriales cyanobacterium LEGE 11467]|uniref:histidine kinase n=1 Tax=Zarconia navalis LEGE 11467 TaxID=1828826 RepID=A0A928VT61_9CYAN|nr:hybrid sensor histidine kinase/response regulator [Zarconia navalis]MBE9039807.1 hybrid sensor histidine kinase/response regulator [Zarconia navalis LEGE 11467]